MAASNEGFMTLLQQGAAGRLRNPPDLSYDVVQTVLEQAEVLLREVAM